MDSLQRRNSDRIGHLRHRLGSQGMCQTTRIRLCTPPRLLTNLRTQALCMRLYHLFAIRLMTPHQRLRCSTREHTLQMPSQQAIHHTRARQVLTAALSLRPADMAQDRCIFLNLPLSMKLQPGQETCKCPAEHAGMDDLMLRTDQGLSVTSLPCASSPSPPVRVVLASGIAASSTLRLLYNCLSGISITNLLRTSPSFAGRLI